MVMVDVRVPGEDRWMAAGGWQGIQQANVAERLHKEMSAWCIDTERKVIETFEATVDRIIFSILAYVNLKKDDNMNARTFKDMAACMNSIDKTRRELALMCSCFILMFIFERNRLQGITCTDISMAEQFAKKCARLSGMSESIYFPGSAGKMFTFKDLFDKMWKKRKDRHQKHLRETVQEYAIVTKKRNDVATADQHSMLRRDKATFFLHKNENRKLGAFIRVLDYRLNDEWNKLLRGVNRDWSEDGLPIDIKLLIPPAPIAEIQLQRSPVSDTSTLTGHCSALETRMALGHLPSAMRDGPKGKYVPTSPPIYCTEEPGNNRGSLVTATTCCPATVDTGSAGSPGLSSSEKLEQYPLVTTDILMHVEMQKEEGRETVKEVLDSLVARVSEAVAAAEENKQIQVSYSGPGKSEKLPGDAAEGKVSVVEPAKKMSNFSFVEGYKELACTSNSSTSAKSKEQDEDQGEEAVKKKPPKETGTVTKRKKKSVGKSVVLEATGEPAAEKDPKRMKTVVPLVDTIEDDRRATASVRET